MVFCVKILPQISLISQIFDNSQKPIIEKFAKYAKHVMKSRDKLGVKKQPNEKHESKNYGNQNPFG
jgi:hypothetical protein